MPGYGRCPRCGAGSLEYLATHIHCWECNYFPEDNLEFRRWRSIEHRVSSKARQLRREDDHILFGPAATRSFEARA